jgi:hypothetical protein
MNYTSPGKLTSPLVTLIAVTVLIMMAPRIDGQQRGGRGGGAAATPRTNAAFDPTGYWVSVISEDWKFRMVTPSKGMYEALTLNGEGRRVADTWDPARDEASGEACRSYGAAGIMRVPGRLHITWENDRTLRIDTDAGTQTRLLNFDASAPAAEPSWQGRSVATWALAAAAAGAGPGTGGGRGGAQPQARGGSLKVVTTNMRSGYVRKNGAPYSKNAVLTEYFDLNTMPNGDQWLTVTTKVDDPQYFSRALLTTSDFKKLPDAAGWNPTPCSAK